jgi:hypothetical protein
MIFKKHQTLRFAARVSAVLTVSILALSAKPSRIETLVPANLQPITDLKGNQWSINNYGFIQNNGNALYNNLNVLHLGNQQFYNYQAMSTADGSEIVLPAQQPINSLSVTRRVKVLEKEGAVRYVDLFTNVGTQPLTTSIEYRHNFSNPYALTLDQLGQPVDRQWGASDQSLLVTVKNGTAKACLFILGGPSGPVRPKILRRTQYEIHIGYTITVAPNQTVGLAMAIAQVANPQPEGDPLAAKKTTALFSYDRFLKSIRTEERATLANFSAQSQDWPTLVKPLDLATVLQMSPSSSDTLKLGAGTQLQGQTKGASLQLQTRHGLMTVPFEQIVAFTGEACPLFSQPHIFLRHGEVLVGKITQLEAQFLLPSESQIALKPAAIDRWWRGQAASAPDASRVTTPVAILRDGTRVRTAEVGGPLTFQTGWGPLTVDPATIEWFSRPTSEGDGPTRLALRDGTSISGLFTASTITLRSPWLPTGSVEPPQLAALVTDSVMTQLSTTAKPAEPPALTTPHLVLGQDQRITGNWAEANLTFLVQGQEIIVPTTSIRRISLARDEQTEESSLPRLYKIDLWSGGHLMGQWAQNQQRWKTNDQTWSVPTRDLVIYQNPQAALTATLREQASTAIQQLGSDEWPVREKASQQLSEMGAAIYPLLRTARTTTEDLEVKNRLDQLLDQLPEDEDTP